METLLVDREDGVVTVTLNRPEKKNAINGRMWRELIEVFDEVEESPETRVLVITGAGDGFCSGADLTDADNAEDLRGGRRRLAAPDADRGSRRAAAPRAARPDDRGGQRRGRRRRVQPRARLRPRRGVRSGAVLGDLLEARAQRRLRWLVDLAPADRPAPGEGARVPRGRHRRDRSRTASAW